MSDINLWRAPTRTDLGSYDPKPPDIVHVEPLWKRYGENPHHTAFESFDFAQAVTAVKRVLELLEDLDPGEAIVIMKEYD